MHIHRVERFSPVVVHARGFFTTCQNPDDPNEVSRRVQLLSLLTADLIAVCVAFWLQPLVRFGGSWFGSPWQEDANTAAVFMVLTAYWLTLFAFSGMYRQRFAESRLDEAASALKVVTYGVLVLVLAIYLKVFQSISPRQAVLGYWGALAGLLVLGRLTVRSIQKALILRGRGVHRALIVGWGDRVEQLYNDVAQYPAAGLRVVGALQMGEAPEPESLFSGGNGVPHASDVLTATRPGTSTYTVESLPRLIDELAVQDVLIALGSDDHEALLEVLRHCDGKPVAFKIVPDFYSIIGGMARTEHIYGLPLIEVLPEPMAAWDRSMKRLLDVSVSTFVLLAGLPIWFAIAVAVKASSHGPVIYQQKRVGRHGSPFTMYKFRTMREDAEVETGPVWAMREDPRYTSVGRWLRRIRLDEVPQLWNVLEGTMSLVGPRPERPFFVDRLAEEIPLYRRRHRVKPGITGWAQVKWGYDATLDDVRQKVKYDLFYIENMSLRMDFQILIQTLRTALSGKGR